MANYAMPTHLKEQCLLAMHLGGTIHLLTFKIFDEGLGIGRLMC
jgi:hypothetical protein